MSSDAQEGYNEIIQALSPTAQKVYDEIVQTLSPTEQLRLATMVLNRFVRGDFTCDRTKRLLD